MGRKSKVDQADPIVREAIERFCRANKLTLDEMRRALLSMFPDAEVPSRSSLGRFKQGFDEMMSHQREIEAASNALVAELGENFDAKSGALLAQAVTTLATRATFDQLEQDEVEIGDVLDLARAAKAANEARSLSFKERQAVAEEARRKLLEEQKAKLDAMGSKGGVTEETKLAIREALGIV
jgi:hypothetical protein